MFYRKITSQLESWYRKESVKKTGLVIEGLRQVGKTTLIRDFAQSHFKRVCEINFKNSPSMKSIFDNADYDHGIPDLFATITSLIPDADFTSEDTLLFLDEIQECGRARYGIKPILANSRIHIIASGSLLGIRGYNREASGDIPTGSEELITMYPMDFEEFMLATGELTQTVDLLKKHFDEKKPIPEALHEKMLARFHQYMVIGGLPEVVDIYMQSMSIPEAQRKLHSLLMEYRGDFGRYVGKDGKPDIDLPLQRKLNILLDALPAQLASARGRFTYASLPNSPRKDQFEDALDWLCQFGLAKKCNLLHAMDLPLQAYANPELYKVYFQDSGLFVSSLGDSAPAHILAGDFSIYKGAIYENIVADAFIKNGRPLYYFANKNGLEVDFVIEHDGKPAIIEVKARSGKTKSSRTILADKKKYGVDLCIKLTSGNIGVADNIVTYPYYLAFLLK